MQSVAPGLSKKHSYKTLLGQLQNLNMDSRLDNSVVAMLIFTVVL